MSLEKDLRSQESRPLDLHGVVVDLNLNLVGEGSASSVRE